MVLGLGVIEMKRREFITLLGGASVRPLAAHAQQGAVPVIGFLSALGRVATTKHVAAFERGLAETGNINGKSVTIEYRFADGQYDRLPALAAEMVRLQTAVIVAQGPPQSLPR
jgi:putative tryptophan/tyrosine transport system substrate-binding protein